MANKNLTRAKKVKNDEFYTQYDDIEKECERYRDQFYGKIIYCNCDDPESSNFFLYFANNFKFFGLKKLITTHYDAEKPTYKLELTEEMIEDGAVTAECAKKTLLKGNGDFRNQESIELLKEADIVITNPPFSLFREYVAQLIEYDKNFLIIGNDNAITYKEIFKLIKDNKIWLGYTRVKEFVQPSGEVKKFGNIGWFTNLETEKRHQELILYKKYNPEEFPKYDNYDAIEVSKVVDIPQDYDGVMGVPITFLDKFNPDQFEIVGRDGDLELSLTYPFYTPPRDDDILRKYKKYSNTWRVQNAYILKADGFPKTVFKRLFIKNKKVSK